MLAVELHNGHKTLPAGLGSVLKAELSPVKLPILLPATPCCMLLPAACRLSNVCGCLGWGKGGYALPPSRTLSHLTATLPHLPAPYRRNLPPCRTLLYLPAPFCHLTAILTPLSTPYCHLATPSGHLTHLIVRLTAHAGGGRRAAVDIEAGASDRNLPSAPASCTRSHRINLRGGRELWLGDVHRMGALGAVFGITTI